jgi:hypothetical protein
VNATPPAQESIQVALRSVEKDIHPEGQAVLLAFNQRLDSSS